MDKYIVYFISDKYPKKIDNVVDMKMFDGMISFYTMQAEKPYMIFNIADISFIEILDNDDS